MSHEINVYYYQVPAISSVKSLLRTHKGTIFPKQNYMHRYSFSAAPIRLPPIHIKVFNSTTRIMEKLLIYIPKIFKIVRYKVYRRAY